VIRGEKGEKKVVVKEEKKKTKTMMKSY